ncbi:hypothetical protein [Sinorhizobium meliloti]|uniref:hypothetical protein n=1 Tax=Rhizobium meliloti TaxID=382 RepID=UPI00299DB514|nr:hypothetical protein [Sinorhizobium meliloti]
MPALIDGVAFGGPIGDKAFDSSTIIADPDERSAKVVISQHPRRAKPLPFDAEMYNWRHLMEDFFYSSWGSSASQCAPTKPTRASTPSSISQQPS